METTWLIAKILGPTLLILSISEYRSISIWTDVHPTVVYLNGMFWFVAGLAIVVLQPVCNDWSVVITILGWMIIILGAFRMFFPRAKQAGKGIFSTIILSILFLLGLLLTYKGYSIEL